MTAPEPAKPHPAPVGGYISTRIVSAPPDPGGAFSPSAATANPLARIFIVVPGSTA